MERHPDSASSPGFRADPSQAQTAPARTWLHRLVNVVVAIVVLAVAAGMFVFSYPGVHAIARQGGVSGQLARFYPALFDAVLVIACVAAVMLRDARWWARCWAWLVAIVILGAIGTTDVLHAMSYGLRQRPTEGVVAAAPVAAVLLAFSLFLTMLRQSRPQPADAARGQVPAGDGAAEQPTAPMMISNVDIVPTLAAGAAARPPAPPIALPAGASPTGAWAADLVDDDVEQAPDAPVTVPEARETAPTQEVPVLTAGDTGAGPGIAGSGEEPVLAAPAAEAPDTTYPPTEPNEAVAAPPPSAAGSEPTREPAPESTPEPPAETTDQPADQATDEAPVEPGPQPAQAGAKAPQAIRYASSAAAEQFGDEDWEAEVDPALAGQVYPVLTSDPDIEVPPHQPGQSQDLEDDAPPFATAPFASVPRLNRVRVSPTPPAEDEDPDEE
jgi:Protein of unknown function (DUF2637)